jgi:hypothetical protein
VPVKDMAVREIPPYDRREVLEEADYSRKATEKQEQTENAAYNTTLYKNYIHVCMRDTADGIEARV